MAHKPLKGQVLVVLHGDHQVGSTIGLAPPKWTITDGHDTLEMCHTPLQGMMWEHWEAAWSRAFRQRLPVVAINVADNIDGDHHGTYQIWSKDSREQADVAVDIFMPKRQKCERWYAVRGTPTHVGQKGTWDEYIAKEVGADHDNGAFSSYHLKVEISGVLFDVLHHGPAPGKRLWTLGDMARKYAQDAVMRAIVQGERPPDVIVRGHVHVNTCEVVNVAGHKCTIIITPAWQLKTEYVYRVATTDDIAKVGLALVRVENGKVLSVDFDLMQLKQSRSMVA